MPIAPVKGDLNVNAASRAVLGNTVIAGLLIIKVYKGL